MMIILRVSTYRSLTPGFYLGSLICFLLLLSLSAPPCFAQDSGLEGRVVELKTGSPVPGANILIIGTGTATSTDAGGLFKFDRVPPGSTLRISFVGYETLEIPVGNRTRITVQMKESTMGLDQVVVIGYGTMKKGDLTSAISVADPAELRKSSATTISEALQGRITGLTVKTSGSPGQTADIYIRGISSMFTNTKPLFVIDGLPTTETRDFNPDDIESIQVLKDASAASIYGSRASNGVIIIQTRKGKAGQSHFDASVKYGIQNITKRYPLMETPEWLAMQRTKYRNAGLPLPQINDTTINNVWQDKIYQTGNFTDLNLSATGGKDDLSYMVSGNYFSNKGAITGPSFERVTTRVNGRLNRNRFTLEESLLLSTSLSRDPVGTPFTDVIRMVPVLPVTDSLGNYVLGNGTYNGDGTRTNGTNPVAHTSLENARNRSYRMQGALNMEYRFFDFLKYKINAGYELNYNDWIQQVELGRWYGNQKSQSSLAENRNLYYHGVVENLLSFDKTFKKHSVSAIAGYSAEQSNYSTMMLKGFNVLQDNNGKYYWTLPNCSLFNAPVQDIQKDALLSAFGRVSYNYAQKYYATASVRRDGSSKFEKDNRYGTFPSASVGWRISKEPFMRNVSFISDLKLRASYGALGNQGIGNYLYTSFNNNFQPYIFDGSNTNIQWGSLQITLVDPRISWETKVTSNLGFDLGLFNNTLQVNFEIYKNKSVNLLNNVALPYYSGNDPGASWLSNSIMRNVGQVENKGMELSATYRKVAGEFEWNIQANLTTNQNRVIALGGNNEPIYGPNTKTEVGRSLGEFFVLQTNGIYQPADSSEMKYMRVFGVAPRPGDERYVDANRDSIIDATDRVYSGSPWPKLEYSLNFSASWKGFDLTIYIFGVQGRTVFNNSKYWLQNTGDNGNYQAGLVPWTPENLSNTTPMASYGKMLRGDTDRFLEDGSFARIKNIQLGYNVPNSFANRIGVNRIRCYLSAENLFTLTRYTGLDPDFKGAGVFGMGYDSDSYPNVRTLSAGIQISF